MISRWPSGWRGATFVFALVVPCLAFAVGVGAAALPPQVVLLAVALISLVALPSRTLLIFAVVCISGLGLLRRLLAPGRVDYDPLILMPIALVLLAFINNGSESSRAAPRVKWATRDGRVSPDVVDAALVVLFTLPFASTVLNGSSTAGLYVTVSQSVGWVLILLLKRGLLPDVWDWILKYAVPLGAVLAIYGALQFFVLFSWDRDWMIASRLTSVGAPAPLEVRVFGASESPGPFAALLGALLIASLVRVVSSDWPIARNLIVSTVVVGMLVVLFLTGVRTALLALLVSCLFVGLRRPTLSRVVGLILGTLAILSVVQVGLSLLSDSGSSLLTEDRYSVANASQDSSLQARLGLLDRVGQALTAPLGAGPQGSATALESIDNAYVYVLVAFGPIVFVALLIVVGALVRAVLLDGRSTRVDTGTVALHGAVVYCLCFTMSGNLFASTTGLFTCVLFGAVLARQQKSGSSLSFHGDRSVRSQ